jgi:hypothetical protein
MLMYATAVLPLINTLKNDEKPVIQNWYADDASAVGKLEHVKEWLNRLSHLGPSYGYYPEPHKSYLVVAPQFLEEAKTLFEDLGVEVVTGHRFLGGFIGDPSSKDIYIQQKVEKWCCHVEKLAEIAIKNPQEAFCAFTKSLQCEWAYLHRVVSDCDQHFDSLEKMIKEKFLPAVFGNEITNKDRLLFSLPPRRGGLGVRNPTETAKSTLENSKKTSEIVIEAIKGKRGYNSLDHRNQMEIARKEFKRHQDIIDTEKLETVNSDLDAMHKRALNRIIENKTSGWLTVLPLSQYQFNMSAVEFRDALALRYRRSLLQLPASCDGCGDPFSIDHSLNCKKGGLIIQRHNEIRDAVGDLASLVWTQVIKEPEVRSADDSLGIPALVADLNIRGVWQPQTSALFDIRVINTDAESYVTRSIKSVLFGAEQEKKRKYLEASRDRRATFTPFITSVDGALGTEARFFINHLTDRLSEKWHRKLSVVKNWVRTRLLFATLRATSQCIRGSRRKWRSIGIEDGAPIRFALQ